MAKMLRRASTGTFDRGLGSLGLKPPQGAPTQPTRTDSRPGTPSQQLRLGRPGTPTQQLQLGMPSRSGSKQSGMRPEPLLLQTAGADSGASMSRSSADLMPNLAAEGRRRQSLSGLGALGMRGEQPPAPSQEDKEERAKRAIKIIQDAQVAEDAANLLQGIMLAKDAKVERRVVEDATKFLQQLEARNMLEHSMKQGDLQGLKRACANAQQAGLDISYLKHGQAQMEKLNAIESLTNALASPETGSLKIAIRRAQGAGLDTEEDTKEMVDTASKTLEQLEAQRMVTLALHGKDKDKLEEAAEKAAAVGVQSAELAQAQAILSEAGGARSAPAPEPSGSTGNAKFDEVRDQLIRAMNLCETGGLRDGIKRAAGCGIGITDMPELEMAKAMLAQMEAMRIVQAAVKGKSHDAKKLKEAVAAAQAAGIENEQTVHAGMLLEEIQAREALSAAITSKDPEKLMEAVGRAQTAGVDRGKITKAQETLQKIQIKEAERAAAGESAPAAQRQPLKRRTLTAGSMIVGLEEPQASPSRPAAARRATVSFG